MRLGDIKNSIKDFWKEFRKVKSGLFGLILLGLFLFILFFEPLLLPFSEANTRWKDITYWEDNPASAAPEWTNLFTSRKRAVSQELEESQLEEKNAGTVRIMEETFVYDYRYDVAPSDMIFKASGSGNVTVIMSVERPDGQKIDLMRKPMEIQEGKELRIAIDKTSKSDVLNFLKKSNALNGVTTQTLKTTDIIFSKIENSVSFTPDPLKGEYRILVSMILQKESDRIDSTSMKVAGRVQGVLGTDNSKRDIWSGVLAGVKWALLIGLLTAVISVSIGVIYGVMSAYLGGWKDSLMQRIFEIFISVPLLPVLIVMSAVFKPSIWVIILIMSIFYWVGPVKTVRSMGLQIKEETYIEASRALGASNARIIFKHMVPLLIPYAFASMALYVPGAIVVEATISLLGLGDATIVTWGQILQSALSGGAVLSGMWWWVVPPGLAIALMGMTFAFVGFAMDKILNPKLKTR
jgi:peptide/nickel transport system permease protein